LDARGQRPRQGLAVHDIIHVSGADEEECVPVVVEGLIDGRCWAENDGVRTPG
jgi:hypothetical protein